MRYLITLLFAALTLNAVGQTNPNYNPDYDADGFISVNDVLGVLSTFGDTWDSGDVIVGCTYPSAVDYNSSANVEDGSCTFLADCAGVINGTSVVDECGVCGGDNSSCTGCDGVANSGLVIDECDVCGGDNSSCADCAGVENGTSVLDECGVCGGDNSTCSGCKDPNADNYDSEALFDDGSCVIMGCTYPAADEYNSSANVDDGSCTFLADCAGVINGTSVVDECGVCGGDNSSCAGCDGVANSGLVNDVCGVCGGDNSSCAGCDGVANSGLVIDECGVCGGDNSCLDECGVPNGDNSTCFTSCGDLVSHDGYDYSTVLIGEQCWFSENCRYLPEVSPSSEASYTSPYYYVYDYQGTDVATAKSTDNYETYGVLYNWPAVMTEGICPSGWHSPSDGEWQTMEMELGMSPEDASSTGWRGYPVGNYLKSTSGWINNGNGSNSSGFTALPGGINNGGWEFQDIGGYGYWWTSSMSGAYSWNRVMHESSGEIIRNIAQRYTGMSARCVRDD